MTSTIDTCETCGAANCISRHGWRCPEALIPVREDRFDDFVKAFGRLVARARKLGCELPTYAVESEWSVVHFGRRKDDTLFIKGGTPVKGVRVTGPRPKFAGWALVATLEPFDDGSATVNLVRSVPGAGDLPESYRSSHRCDHCRTSRYRAETFVVRHDDGRLMQVGRNCIRDFLGGSAPSDVAALFTYAVDCASFGPGNEDAGGGWGGWGGEPSVWSLEIYLALVIREIQANGWVPRSMARDRGIMATSDAAFQRMRGSRETRPEHPLDSERAAAREAIAWASQLDGSSDFEHNIRAIAKSRNVTWSTLGMGAAIYSAHQRHLEREIKRLEIAKASASSRHVGAVKARLDLTLSVTAIYDTSGQYGATFIHAMVDADGNVYKWFSSGTRLEIGRAYAVRGTVKSHGEYKGRKETVLTRCKCTEAPTPTGNSATAA